MFRVMSGSGVQIIGGPGWCRPAACQASRTQGSPDRCVRLPTSPGRRPAAPAARPDRTGRTQAPPPGRTGGGSLLRHTSRRRPHAGPECPPPTHAGTRSAHGCHTGGPPRTGRGTARPSGRPRATRTRRTRRTRPRAAAPAAVLSPCHSPGHASRAVHRPARCGCAPVRQPMSVGVQQFLCDSSVPSETNDSSTKFPDRGACHHRRSVDAQKVCHAADTSPDCGVTPPARWAHRQKWTPGRIATASTRPAPAAHQSPNKINASNIDGGGLTTPASREHRSGP